MIFRLRYKKLGGHIHCRLFEAPTSVETFAKNGDLVFDERSWPAFQSRMSMAGIEVVQEDDATLKRKRGTPPYVPPFESCSMCVNGWCVDAAAGRAWRCSCYQAYQAKVAQWRAAREQA